MDNLLNPNASIAGAAIDQCFEQKDLAGMATALRNDNLFVKIYTINSILEMDEPSLIPQILDELANLKWPISGGEDLSSIEEVNKRVVAFVNKWKNKDYQLEDPTNKQVTVSQIKEIRNDTTA